MNQDIKTDDRASNIWKYFSIALAVAAAFVAIIAALGSRLVQFEKPVDQGSWWYYWQLAQPSFWSHLSAWGLYIAHQAFVWFTVYKLVKAGSHHDKMLRLNWVALWGNLGFMALHLAQTHIFYDGLAQDVPVWSSQWSVIIMLVLVVYLMIPRRGIVFGLRIPVGQRLYQWIRKYHGFYISWALVYTFWFHPMEGDYGLLTGFFYMFLLFIQMSFAGTKVHNAIGWITVLELTVGLHGPAISLQKAISESGTGAVFTDGWPMFAFGFIGVFIWTGQFGFRMPKLARLGVFALYFGLAALVYSFRGYNRLFEISFIPVALIGGGAVIAVIGRLFFNRIGREFGK